MRVKVVLYSFVLKKMPIRVDTYPVPSASNIGWPVPCRPAFTSPVLPPGTHLLRGEQCVSIQLRLRVESTPYILGTEVMLSNGYATSPMANKITSPKCTPRNKSLPVIMPENRNNASRKSGFTEVPDSLGSSFPFYYAPETISCFQMLVV